MPGRVLADCARAFPPKAIRQQKQRDATIVCNFRTRGIIMIAFLSFQRQTLTDRIMFRPQIEPGASLFASGLEALANRGAWS